MDNSLTKELCNHLYLGQWEMMLAFLQSYKASRSADESVLKALRIVAQTPSNASVDHQPWLLAWQCCSVLENFPKCDQEFLSQNAEFHILLSNTLKQELTCCTVLQNLEECYAKMLSHDVPVQLSELCLKILKEAFTKRPFPIHCLLTKLLAQDGNSQLALQLHNIYTATLQSSVFNFKSGLLRQKNVDQKQLSDLRERLLTVLNLMPDSVLENAASNQTVSLCLNELSGFILDNKLCVGDVYGALLGRESPRLLQMFQKIEESLFSCSDDSNVSPSLTAYLAKASLHEKTCFRSIFLRMYNRKEHFIKEILGGSVESILCGGWQRTLRQLNEGWMGTLTPLAACLAWRGCGTSVEANHILSLIQEMVMPEEPLQRLLVHLLKENVFVTEWIASHWRDGRISASSSGSADLLGKKRNIFGGLQNQSALSAVHRFLGLQSVCHLDVLQMLDKVKDDRVSTLTGKVAEMGDQTSVYRAYITLSSIMDAIRNSSELQNKNSTFHNLNLSTGSADEVPENKPRLSLEQYYENYGFDRAYKEFVTNKLKTAKEQFDQIRPATYQTEILENIFSLLFITHNDFVDYTFTPNESDEGHVGIDVTTPSVSPTKKIRDGTHYSFSMSTVPLKEGGSQRTSDSVPLLCSSPGFTTTTSNEGSNTTRIGFLCTQMILRDILDFLKVAIEQVFISRTADTLERKVTVDSPLTSVSVEHQSERLSHLAKYVAQALWRLEICSSDLETPDPPSPVSQRHRQLHSASPTGSNFVADSNKESMGKDVSKRRKKRWAHRNSILEGRSWIRPNGDSIIYRMLASPVALLTHSILSRNYKLAKEVSKMFSLKGTSEGQEAKFSMKLQELLQKLNSLSDSGTGRRESLSVGKKLSGLAMAAAQGLETTSKLQVVDVFLGQCTFPVLAEIETLKLSDGLDTHPVIRKMLLTESQEQKTIVLSDIAYTSCLHLDQTRSLLSMNPSDETINERKRTSKINISEEQNLPVVGILETAETMSVFFNEMVSLVESGYGTESTCPFYPSVETPPQMVVRSLGPLGAQSLRRYVDTWQKFVYQKNLVWKMISEEDQAQVVILGNDRNNAGILNAAFTRFAKLCSSKVQFFEGTWNAGRYLEAVNRRLEHVSVVLKKYAANKGLGWMMQRSHLAILKHNLDQLLGHLILRDIVSLDKLEELAKEIQMNLVHVIARTCYPSLPNTRVRSPFSQSSRDDTVLQKTLSNNSVLRPVNNRNPEVVTRQLLNEIVQLIKDTCADKSASILTWSAAVHMCQETTVTCWLDLVPGELSTLDLNLLVCEDEKLTFYVNLVNVCYLHALFSGISTKIKTSRTVLPEMISLVSSHLSERLYALSTTFYSIGELRAISLLELWHWFSLSLGQHPGLYLIGSPFSKAFDNGHLDKLKELIPYVDPRAVFALTQGFVSSPKLQVFTPETVTTALNNAMEDYLNFFTEVNVTSKVIRLPELLFWHRSLFLKEERDGYEGLVSFISLHLRGGVKDSVQRLQSKSEDCVDFFWNNTSSDVAKEPEPPLKAELSPFVTQFGIVLSYNEQKGPPKPPKVQMRPAHQNLPAHASEYIAKQCPLVSNLLHLFHTDLSKSDEPLQRQIHLHRSRCQLLGGGEQFDWLSTALGPVVCVPFLWKQFQLCFNKDEHLLALDYLEESEYLQLPAELSRVRELTLKFLAAGGLCQDADGMPWSFALRLEDEMERCRTVLDNVDAWPTSVGLETVAACLGASHSSYKLYQLLQEKMVLTVLQNKILRVVNKRLVGDQQKPLRLWTEVELLILDNPDQFLPCLYNEPELLVQWAETGRLPKNLPTDCVQEIWNQVLTWLLIQTPLDTVRLNAALEALPHRSLESILCLVDGCTSTLGQAFLADYALQHLQLDLAQMDSIQNLKIGIQMIALVHDSEDYKSIISEPIILLEQLIMRLEIETVGHILKVVKEEAKFPMNEANSLLERYASKSMEFSIVDAIIEESVDNISVGSSTQFLMPSTAPEKEAWTPNSASSGCMICFQKFGMFCRRHHCRRCGRLVCATCSRHNLVVSGYSNIPVRVCNDCFEQTNVYVTQTSDTSSVTGPTSPSAAQLIGPQVFIPSLQHTSSLASIFGPMAIFLTSDPVQNQAIRDEFCYEQAPSVNLCLSLLQLHSDSLACGRCMLSQCDQLFILLQPPIKGRANSQVDYALIISMMRTLVLSAKVKFLELGNAEEEAVLCDSYLRSLDLINMLVRNNCTHLIPNSRRPMLNSPEAVRRLLEQLLEEERFPLALEVATKCALDHSSLWAAWGMLCLRAGHWAAARDKFARCFQKPQDVSSRSQENPLIKEIINSLENSRVVTNGQIGAIIESLKSLKNIQSGASQLVQGERANLEMLNECQFYLRQYGSPASLVVFFLRHDLIQQAVMYIVEKGWDSDLFLNSLLLPSAQVGRLEVVLQQLRSQDPTLSRWWLPLVAACQHLQKNRMYKLLHTLQSFMGDYIRAGMTCIYFYKCPCRDYTELADRLQHLLSARRCFETFLRLSQLQGLEQKKHVLHLPSKAVQGYIETVYLQTELTTYLCACQENEPDLPHLSEVEKSLKMSMGQSEEQEDSTDAQEKPNCPPTLFDSTSRKKALVCFVLYCSLKNKQGVDLAARIMRSHGLDVNQVCSGVGQLLVQQGRVKEIPTFLSSVQESVLGKSLNTDQVILSCIQKMSETLSQNYSDASPLIELLVNKINKIDAYITCRKLKSAYTAAIRLERVDLVSRIQEVALQCGQVSVANFCERWLKMKESKDKS